MSPSNSQLSNLNSPLIPPGYKQTEVGVIPEEWDESPVADVITSFQNGFAFASHGYVKSGIPIVTMAQIGLDGRFNFTPESVNYWPAEAASALLAFQLFRGDIIIAMTDVTPQKNLIGRMAEVTEIGPLLLNQRVGLLRLDSEKIDPYFLRAISNSSRWRGYARAVASLGVQANIGTKDIRAGKIPLPPLPEQRAIATALSDVDGLLGGLDRLIAKKRDLKQAAMQQLLTGQTRLPGFEVETGTQQTELGKFPMDWAVKQIRNVCRLINGRGFKPHEWQTTGLPIIRIQNLNGSEDFNYYSGQYDSKILVEHGQLLFAWSGSRGTSFGPHVWRGGKALLNYHTWKVVINESCVDPGFLVHAFRQITTYIEDRAHGASALVHTQKWEMEKFPIAIPLSIREQTAIAEVLTEMDGELAGLEQRREKTRALKQAMMQELLTGRTRLV